MRFKKVDGHAWVVAGRKAEWVSSSEQMDRSLLMARDPILYFDEVPLYESELDDNGASQLGVKVLPSQHESKHVLSNAWTSETCSKGFRQFSWRCAVRT